MKQPSQICPNAKKSLSTAKLNNKHTIASNSFINMNGEALYHKMQIFWRLKKKQSEVKKKFYTD